MDIKEFWEELVAQVESHGLEVVEFWTETTLGEPMQLSVSDVKYEDGVIKVTLE
jgi:hypothetical protein